MNRVYAVMEIVFYSESDELEDWEQEALKFRPTDQHERYTFYQLHGISEAHNEEGMVIFDQLIPAIGNA